MLRSPSFFCSRQESIISILTCKLSMKCQPTRSTCPLRVSSHITFARDARHKESTVSAYHPLPQTRTCWYLSTELAVLSWQELLITSSMVVTKFDCKRHSTHEYVYRRRQVGVVIRKVSMNLEFPET